MEQIESTSDLQHTVTSFRESDGQPQQQTSAVSTNFNQVSLTNAPVILGGENINIVYNQPQCGDQLTSDTEKAQMCSTFSESTKAAAREVSGTNDKPIDLDKCIQWAKLEIVTDILKPPENFEDLWTFHYRRYHREGFTLSDSTVELKDLFKIAKERSKTEATSHGSNEEAQKRYILEHGNIVMTLGQAGIGKTTLCKLLIKLILDDSASLGMDEGCEYIFYIPLRTVNYTKETSFFKFLIRSSACRWKCTKESEDILLDALGDGSKAILIMDGLEEAILSTNTFCRVVAGDECTAENFIKGILTGDILPAAKKLITSQPRKFYALDPSYRQHFVVSVTGLNKPEQDELCKQICNSDSKRVIKFLNDHPSLSSHCYVPVNCILTSSCIHNMMKKHGERNLVSITSVMFYSIDQFVRSEHFKGNRDNNLKQLQQLAHLAWYGIDSKKIIFEVDDFQKLGIEENTLRAFMQTYVDLELKTKIYDGDKKSYFVHLIWQEFFAAIELMQFMSVQDFERKVSCFSDPKFEMVLKFVYGFCNPDLISGLQKLYLGGSSIKDKKRILKSLALSLTVEHSLMETRESDSEVQIEKTLICDKVSRLAFTWLCESQDFKMRTDYIDHFSDTIIIVGDIFPSNINCIHCILAASCKPHRLEIVDPIFIGNCINRFLTMMVKTLGSPSFIKLTTLDVSNHEVDEDGAKAISCCLRNLANLGLRKCELTAAAISIIAKGIQELCSLTTLDVSENVINEDHAKAISFCLNKLKKLRLEGCELTAAAIKIIAHGIERLSCRMKYLDITHNKMTIKGCEYLASCLPNIEQLVMRNCEMGAEMVKVLCNAIKTLQKPIKVLNVSHNKFGDDGARAILCCLNKIEKKLYMEGCDIMEVVLRDLVKAINNSTQLLKVFNFCYISNQSGPEIKLSCGLNLLEDSNYDDRYITAITTEVLAAVITKLTQPLMKLDISYNKFGDEGVSNLSRCLSNIKKLHVRGCDIKIDGITTLTTAVAKLSEHLMELHLNYISFGNEGASQISNCLFKVKKLYVKRCNITIDGINAMATAIDNLSQPMEELTIDDNMIKSEGLTVLSSCLHNVERLHLYDCAITAHDEMPSQHDKGSKGSGVRDGGISKSGISLEGIESLACTIRNRSRPMKYLNLGCNMITFDGYTHLASCLRNIEQLELKYCKMDAEMIEVLCNAIKDLQKPMKCLDITHNEMTIKGCKHLASCLPNIEQLVMRKCEMGAEMFEVLCNAIKNLQKPLQIKFLDISLNKMTIDGCVHLASCLKNIQQLVVRECKLEAEMVEELCNAIKNLPKPLQQLNLDANELDENCIVALASCLFNVDRLIIRADKVAIQKILNAIKQSPRRMKYLEFTFYGYYTFNQREMEALCAALHKIEKLDIAYCTFTKQNLNRIAAELSLLQDPKPVVRMHSKTPVIHGDFRFRGFYIEDDS